MAEITAALVKELREKTGAGMMDCKRALSETEGDLEGAVDWLRKKGLAAAAKKAGRVAAEGLVGVAVKGKSAPSSRSMPRPISSRATTRSRSSCATVAELALDAMSISTRLKAAPYPGTGRNVAEELTALDRHDRREHVAAPRWRGSMSPTASVASYVHNAVAPNLGKIGVLVALESDGRRRSPGRRRPPARHACRRGQPAVSRHRLGSGRRARARARRAARAGARRAASPTRSSRRWSRAGCANSTRRASCSSRSSSSTARPRSARWSRRRPRRSARRSSVAGFVRFALGEGIEKEQTDFAAEVAATAEALSAGALQGGRRRAALLAV